MTSEGYSAKQIWLELIKLSGKKSVRRPTVADKWLPSPDKNLKKYTKLELELE